MRILRLGSVSLVSVGLLLAGHARPISAQSSCLDQEYRTGQTNGLEITGSQSAVQTVTCGRAGMLLRVDVDIRHWVSGVTAPLTVNVLATDANGVPTNQVLASEQLAPTDIPVSAYAMVPVRFAQPTMVVVGQVVGIELSVPTTVARAYAWSGDAPGNYGGGTTWLRRTTGPLSFDMGFRTFVGAPAFAVGYGNGHAGANGVPPLTASAPPRLGTSLDLVIGNSAISSTAGVLVLGTSRASVPTPFGGTLLVQPLAQLALTVPAIGATVPLRIPDLPSLCGTTLDIQAALADAGASHGVAFTPGLELGINP